MKLVKLALLSAAMVALSACDANCKKCDCKVPDTINQKEAYKLFKALYTKMTTNSVFDCEINYYEKDNDAKGTLSASGYMTNVQLDENFIEFTSSTRPEVLRFLADRALDNKLFELDDEGNWVETTNGLFEVPSSSLELEIGSAYCLVTKELKRVSDGLSGASSLVNYVCNDYVCTFDYLRDAVTMECAYGKGGLKIKRLSIVQEDGYHFIDHVVNFISYGDAAPTHLL